MKALVTGGCGFIGSHIVDRLLKKGYNVKVLDNLSEPVHPGNRVPAYFPGDVELIRGDIRDKKLLAKAMEDVDVIFHKAAHQGYLGDYSTFFSINSTGTALIYEIIAEKKLEIKKIVIASSQAVYGEGNYNCLHHGRFAAQPRSLKQLQAGDWEQHCPVCNAPGENLPAVEDTINPNTQYALSKYTQEMIGFNLGKRHNIPTTCLRYSIVLGRRQSFYNSYSGILRSFASLMKTGTPPLIFEDGLLKRDYIHIDDVVDANMIVLENPASDFQAYNVGTGIAVTVTDFFHMLAHIMNFTEQPRINGDFRIGEVRHIVSSPRKLESIGWTAQRSIQEMMQDYLDFLRESGEVVNCFNTAFADMKRNNAIQTAVKQGVL